MTSSGINRREFLRILTIAVAAYPISTLAEKRQFKPAIKKYKEPWLTLSAVQEHLFPAEDDSPGAKDINALLYLRNMLATPDFDKEESALIKNGVGWLNDLSTKEYKKTFIQLDSAAKEKVLRRIESSNAGSRWLSLLLTYLIEALLTDPAYGGNPNGIGWQWLQHQPGFPRPTTNKQYFKLNKLKYGQTRTRTTKA